MRHTQRLFLFFLFYLLGFPATAQERPVHLDRIKLPPGFKIHVYARVPNARSMVLSEKGTLFVGNRQVDRNRRRNVYAVRDHDGDFRADQVYTLAEGLWMPNGVALHNGSLFVAEVNRILRFDNIESRLENPPEPVVIYDGFPTDEHHGWKFIAFGPDDKLYVPVGAPCNICNRTDVDERYGTITRMNPDGTGLEVFARGIRNTVGFTWHPVTQELWFTDNGRDHLGDDVPPDELNRVPRSGLHFGYPFWHGKDIPDPEFGEGRTAEEFTLPEQELGPHVAALGLEFYTGTMFPEEYHNQIFIAEHGSWNRTNKIGYRISLVRLDGKRAVSYETFAEGWQQGVASWGRPVDLELLPDGSLLVSDDSAGAIYRIYYAKPD